ncbi:hypothetical protein Scep_008562 [Stephania cephalantha]|uniref:WRKY domain-containing protein n=1 Tax=Stephania cephalantha TaxID=152367 RepID=A0AAP0KEN1_9MAGN
MVGRVGRSDLGILMGMIDGSESPLKDHDPKKEFDQSNFTDLALKLSTEQQVGDLVEKINRVSVENKKLSEMLTVMCENYNALQIRLIDLKRNNSPNNIKEASPISKKRKTDQSDEQSHNNISSSNGEGDHYQHGNSEISSSEENANNNKKQIRIREDPNSKTSVMYVHSDPSDSRLIVKDGYLWRKYGQKVTRDNPSPRAYFKCSFAPSCPVKKKVQRSVKDQSVLVATYEGEHNHPCPSEADVDTSTMGSKRGAVQHGSSSGAMCNSSSSPIRSSGSTIILDLTQNSAALLKPPRPEVETSLKNNYNNKNVKSAFLQHFLVEQMASSLSKDPSFTAALAAAISGNFLQK